MCDLISNFEFSISDFTCVRDSSGSLERSEDFKWIARPRSGNAERQLIKFHNMTFVHNY